MKPQHRELLEAFQTGALANTALRHRDHLLMALFWIRFLTHAITHHPDAGEFEDLVACVPQMLDRRPPCARCRFELWAGRRREVVSESCCIFIHRIV